MTRYLPLLCALLLACSSAVDDVECTSTDQCGIGLACVGGDCLRVDGGDGGDVGAPEAGADAGAVGDAGVEGGAGSGVDAAAPDVSGGDAGVSTDVPDVSGDALDVSTDLGEVSTGDAGGWDAGPDVGEDVVVPGDGCLAVEDLAALESAEYIGGALWQCLTDDRGFDACIVEYRVFLRETYNPACTDCILEYDQCAADSCLDECSQGLFWHGHPCERCRRVNCDDLFVACAGVGAPYP